ncbi:MAG: M1 family metallopeptidase, partial [Alcanivoracaceae bacterium]|nr:M1 family metallopeptidase [Alcanivoracaceae bacterium]
EKLRYALKHTQEIIESLENYFQIPYPYLKLDIIAVPDFSAGAMENAGAITYREQLLLLDENSSQSQKRSYMTVHAHELAHQWFGNLVTPYWWNDIWLNEAFATWMSYTALQTVYPEQNFDQTILKRSLDVMESDSLVSARKIRQEIKSNHDISSAFDGITYSKGGGVLEMMNTFLTPEQFRKGIQNYMTKFAFKNATADDFILAISAASKNIPPELIKTSFNSFLEQAGIPYLNIVSSCEDGINKIALKQSRYLPLGSQGKADMTWQIPACLTYEIDGNKHQDCQMVDSAEQQFTLAGNGCAQYIMPNANGSGYYRYALMPESWENLYKNINKLSTNEIISLNDSFSASVESGKIDFQTLMTVAPIIAESKLDNIATAPMSIINYMQDKVAESAVEVQKLATVANQLYQQKYQQLGFSPKVDDSVEDKKLRRSVVDFMAITGKHQEIRSQLTIMAKHYTGYKGDNKIHEDVDTNLIALALEVAVEDLDQDFTNHLITLFDQANDGTLRGRLLGGISSSKNQEFIAQLRDWILSDRLRGNEIYTILFTQIYDKDNQQGMWQWVQDNFEPFKKRMPTWFQGRLPLVGSDFCSLAKKKELTDYFAPIVEGLSGGPRSLAQVTEGIDLCIAKREHYMPMLKAYLNVPE